MKQIYTWVFCFLFILMASSCQSAQPEKLLTDTIAQTITSAQTFEVTPENVVQALQEIVTVESNGPDDYAWTFTGSNPQTGVLWALAEFQPDDEGDGWTLLHIQLALASADASGQETWSELYNAIEGNAGQPSWGGEDYPDKRAGWSVAEFWEVILHESEFPNPLGDDSPHVLLVEAAVSQGEADY